MSKGLDVNVEIGLCTKEMARDNPIKDFEILVEEYKDKWSKQMYGYFKECVSVLKKKDKALKIIKKYGYFDNDTGNLIIHIPDGKIEDKEYDLLKEVLK